MYYLEKIIWISSAHHLNNYEGKCKNLHGHNWKVVVKCKGEKLDKAGMLIDFGKIKDIVTHYDHANLNDKMDKNPTAENLAEDIYKLIPFCYEVTVEETEGNKVTYKCY